MVSTASGLVSSWREGIFNQMFITFLFLYPVLWFRFSFFIVVSKQKSLKKNLCWFPQLCFHSFTKQYWNAFIAYFAAPSYEHTSRMSHAAVLMCICFCFFSCSAFFKQLCHWSEMNTASEIAYISFIFVF